MSSNRIRPSGKPKEPKKNIKRFFLNRINNAREWTLSALGLPQGLLWLPISFCFLPPTVSLSKRPFIKKMAREAKSNDKKFVLNFALIVEGMFTVCTGGCFMCGCCTAVSPSSVYE